MKYTKEQLQAMSDFEVNKALAKLVTGYGLPASCCLDYCNTPNDIMPLAFERNIGLMFNWNVENKWSAVSAKDYDDINPLRAIACCLILVLQGEKE